MKIEHAVVSGSSFESQPVPLNYTVEYSSLYEIALELRKHCTSPDQSIIAFVDNLRYIYVTPNQFTVVYTSYFFKS